MSDYIVTDVIDGIGRITLNRPAAINALDECIPLLGGNLFHLGMPSGCQARYHADLRVCFCFVHELSVVHCCPCLRS